MTDQNTNSGVAALTICESLLLALSDHKVLPEADIMHVLADAAGTHENAAGTGREGDAHWAVAALIRKITAGGNSVRRA